MCVPLSTPNRGKNRGKGESVPRKKVEVRRRLPRFLSPNARAASALAVEVWTRNSVIKRLAAEGGGQLGSGVEEPDVVISDAQVIFRVCEVHGPEYPPGPKFR